MNARTLQMEGRSIQDSKLGRACSYQPSSVSSYVVMARGWESKAVESQIESNQDRLARLRPPGKTPEELARERQIDGLQLSRSRVLSDIGSASNPGYKLMLERSLAFLDEKLRDLEK